MIHHDHGIELLSKGVNISQHPNRKHLFASQSQRNGDCQMKEEMLDDTKGHKDAPATTRKHIASNITTVKNSSILTPPACIKRKLTFSLSEDNQSLPSKHQIVLERYPSKDQKKYVRNRALPNSFITKMLNYLNLTTCSRFQCLSNVYFSTPIQRKTRNPRITRIQKRPKHS